MGERETVGDGGRRWERGGGGGKVAVFKKEKILDVGNAEKCFENTSRQATECFHGCFHKFFL